MYKTDKHPLVSIVVCTRDRAQLLQQTMGTIMAQQYRPVEIVVVDDGSTDDTSETVRRYGEKVRYYRKKSEGIAAARTYGCKVAAGEFIAFQDDDDLMPHNRIDILLAAIQENPQSAFAVGEWEVIDGDGNHTGRRSSFKASANGPMVIEKGYQAVLWPYLTPLPHTTIFRKSDAERIGWFDAKTFFHACSDTDFFARLGKLGHIVYVPEVVSYYRMGHAQIWGRRLLAEYSRVLLFEKHLKMMTPDQTELRDRLRARLLEALKAIAFLQMCGEHSVSLPGKAHEESGLSLLSREQRISYNFYRSVGLRLRRLRHHLRQGAFSED